MGAAGRARNRHDPVSGADATSERIDGQLAVAGVGRALRAGGKRAGMANRNTPSPGCDSFCSFAHFNVFGATRAIGKD